MNSIAFFVFFVFRVFVRGIVSEPKVADVFGLDFEVNIYADYPDRRVSTALVDLDYDKFRQQIAFKILSEGNVERGIIDFNSSQIFTIANSENKYGCKADKCTNEGDSVCRRKIGSLFPEMGKFDISFGHIFPGLQILGHGTESFTSAGPSVWENITVDKWVTVHENTTTTSHWTTSNWITPVDPKWGALPVFAQLTDGTAKSTQQVVPIYYEPRHGSDDESFQPTEGVFCSDWPATKTFPNEFESKVFEFRTEGIRENDTIISWSREWFNLDDGLIRLDYLSSVDNSTVTKIIDYNESVIFEIGSGGCKSRGDLNMQILDSPSVVNLLEPMTSTNDFFGSAEYKYVGKRRSSRGTENLVWQGIGNDEIGSDKIEALWEWYLDKAHFELGKYIPTRRSYKVISLGNGNKKMVKPGDKIVHQIYGFQYSSKEKVSDNFNAVSCYRSAEIRHLQFEIKADKSNNSDAINETILTPKFRFVWRQRLAIDLQVSLLRISAMRGSRVNNKVMVEFKLLKPKSDAVETLEKRINEGTFDAMWTDENSREWSFTAVPNTLSAVIAESCKPNPSVSEKSEYRTKGLATGVGVGCFTFGVGFGLTSAYFARFQLLRYF